MSEKVAPVPPSQIIGWTIRKRLLTNRYILRDMIIFFIAVCAFFFVLLAGIALLSDNLEVLGTYLLLWAAACSVLLVLMLVAIVGYFANRTEFTYEITEEGITMRAGKKERRINSFAIVVGLLTGNIRALGAGLMGASRQDYFVPWEDISRATFRSGPKMIVLKAGPIPGNRIFCTDENYGTVERAIRKYAKKATFTGK